ncbi:endonuclease/exonuclease/phosphatase family protein [Nesterenkonia sp. LB17]|uniref:endonuclease/exonuclease/phosphatase family protein n=1 Tax=Nesterenkonia sp. LB17 TaxID=2901230 RepID=UPI001F4CB79F|nr:endonuclease/exonuclease/phosphatase family protein [Nesterenkonia sp. LB17]MCH8566543.1 endonuclease/exonuclease/phosphatase family protein [Nesterenkonia sp. LB17]
MRSGFSSCLVAGLLVAGSSGAHATTTSSDSISSETGSGAADGPTTASYYPTPGQPLVTPESQELTTTVEKAAGDIRVATLHAQIRGASSAEVLEELHGGMHPQARVLAETVQVNAPDVLVLTGLSYDEHQQIATTVNDEYLSRGQNGQTGIKYSHVYTAPTNSGIDSGADLDGDGRIGGPADALGYGRYAGERGMAVFSTYPIAEDEVRTFQEFLWQDMPENSMPADEFSDLEKSVLPLPSTSLWDIPVEVPGEADHVHVVATDLNSPPGPTTPDVARSEDQRRMVAEFVSGASWYLYDDEGAYGGLESGTPFVVAGSLADAQELQTWPNRQVPELASLLNDATIQDPGPEAITDEPLPQRRDAAADPQATHGLTGGDAVRSSYVLPAAALDVDSSGVFWPAEGEFGFNLVDPADPDSPVGRLVWLDIAGS